MKFTVYVTRRSIDIEGSKAFYYKPYRMKYYETEADGLLDAMAKFAKDEKKLIKSNEKLGWTTTHTANGFIMRNGDYIDEYTDISFNS